MILLFLKTVFVIIVQVYIVLRLKSQFNLYNLFEERVSLLLIQINCCYFFFQNRLFQHFDSMSLILSWLFSYVISLKSMFDLMNICQVNAYNSGNYSYNIFSLIREKHVCNKHIYWELKVHQCHGEMFYVLGIG